MFGEFLFNCVICQRDVHDIQQRNGRDRHLAPICLYCEGHWCARPIKVGAFMDRRIAGHVACLAEALANTASIMEWERQHGRA